jgi:hypothetical protein
VLRQWSRIRPLALVVVGAAIVLMTKGLGLWADVPGPRPDRNVRVESFRPQGETDPAVNVTIKFR